MVSLLDAQKNFSKKPIVQLTAIDQLKILVSLSGDYFFITILNI